jgi:hypothetical protein
MKDREPNRHPGPMRMMQGDGEPFAIFVAIAFLVLGLVAMPEARPFFLGTLAFGVAMALVLRLIRR